MISYLCQVKQVICAALAVDFSFVECVPVALGVAVVLAQGGGKVVRAREILFGAHVEVVVVGVVEYGIQSDGGGDADGAWR